MVIVYSTLLTEVVRDEDAVVTMIQQQYADWKASYNAPFVNMSLTCRLVDEAIGIHGLQETITTLSSDNGATRKFRADEAIDLTRTVFNHLNHSSLTPNVEMQLQSPASGLVGVTYLRYIPEGLLFHLVGTLAIERLQPTEVFNALFQVRISTGDAVHGAIGRYVSLQNEPAKGVREIMAWDVLQPCHTRSFLWDCWHGVGHGFFLHIASKKNPTISACNQPHVLFASVRFNEEDLAESITLCEMAQYEWETLFCASGVFHNFFRYALEFAIILEGFERLDQKVLHTKNSICSDQRFSHNVSRVCLGQVLNRASGRYVFQGSFDAMGELLPPHPEPSDLKEYWHRILESELHV